MSTSGFTVVPAKPVRPSRRLTTWAYLVQLAYIPWLMVMFALGTPCSTSSPAWASTCSTKASLDAW